MPRQHLSNSNIQALASRAGIVRTADAFRQEVREQIRGFLEDILRKAINVMKLDGVKTLSTKHIELNLPVSMFSEKLTIKRCGPRKAKKSNAEKDVKHYQSCNDLIFRRLSFAKFVREIANDIEHGLRISANALILLQHYIEARVTKLMEAARHLAASAKRKTVYGADFSSAVGLSVKLNHSVSNTNIEKMANFTPYIKLILKDLSDKSITSDAASQLNFIVNVVANKIGCAARSISKKKTLDSKAIETANMNILVGELNKHAMVEARKAMQKFSDFQKSGTAKVSTSQKAGLKLSVSRVMNLLKGVCKQRISILAAVYLTALLEYIAAEILNLASVKAHEHNRVRITANCLKSVISEDEELAGLMKNLNVDLINSGVNRIHDQ